MSAYVCIYFSRFSWPETLKHSGDDRVICVDVFMSLQVQMITNECSHTITDAMPGVEYLIQVRTKDEYDGQWSEWSTPIYASTWTGKHTCRKSVKSSHFKIGSCI